MRYFIPIVVLFLFSGCTYKVAVTAMPDTSLKKAYFSDLKGFNSENFDEVVDGFLRSCQTKKAQDLYGRLCQKALHAENKKEFIKDNFKVLKVMDNESDMGTLTGYYEPELRGSLTKHDSYIYPLYQKPDDMYEVDFSSAYPELKKYNLSGRIEGNKVVPYYTRAEYRDLNASAICYVDDKIDEYFLEIQGSGRVVLDTNETMYVGYGGNNGHKYTSMGKYLIDSGEMDIKNMSLKKIKEWAANNPEKVDHVLNQNARVIYFKKRNGDVKGALGIALTPMRSVAVDSKYIPLGSMLFIDAKDAHHSINSVVFAQDRGSAIKSAIRADLFTGFGDDALDIAGNLKAKLKIWVFLPKVDVR
ncbi:murein transglycosylase A [bacterium]|nr:murein transglycosylase A [bacterium]MBU1882963.1 murein transglycosylase A [bacterium]